MGNRSLLDEEEQENYREVIIIFPVNFTYLIRSVQSVHDNIKSPIGVMER